MHCFSMENKRAFPNPGGLLPPRCPGRSNFLTRGGASAHFTGWQPAALPLDRLDDVEQG